MENYFTVKYKIADLTRTTMVIATSKEHAIEVLSSDFPQAKEILKVKNIGPLLAEVAQ